jgi:predicted nucleic acid-binding Zn ribbon protein
LARIKWTIHKVKNYIENCGGILVSTVYRHANDYLEFKCPDCGKKFERRWSKITQGQSVYCKECAQVRAMRHLRKDHLKVCERCGGPKAHKSTSKLCRKCWAASLEKEEHPNYGNPNNRFKGEDNPAWNGGGINYWKRQIVAVGACDYCGYDGTALVAHHLNAKSSNPNEETDLNNGVCLCANCHMEFHLKFGNNCTKEQYYTLKESRHAAM